MARTKNEEKFLKTILKFYLHSSKNFSYQMLINLEILTIIPVWDLKGHLVGLGLGEKSGVRIEKRLRQRFGSLEFLPAPQKQKRELEILLKEYLSGKRRLLQYPLRLLGTPFELVVWRTLRQIPYGETRTYQWLARAIGRPSALRAVGRALAANPLPLFIPCHRIVAKKGLGGFSGGLELKAFLLDLEKRFSQNKSQ